jgi:hypothetical protein
LEKATNKNTARALTVVFRNRFGPPFFLLCLRYKFIATDSLKKLEVTVSEEGR